MPHVYSRPNFYFISNLAAVAPCLAVLTTMTLGPNALANDQTVALTSASDRDSTESTTANVDPIGSQEKGDSRGGFVPDSDHNKGSSGSRSSQMPGTADSRFSADSSRYAHTEPGTFPTGCIPTDGSPCNGIDYSNSGFINP